MTQLGTSLASLAAAGLLLALATDTAHAQHPHAKSRTADPPDDPLRAIVAEALRNNPGLEQERLLEARAAADERVARGRYFPSVTVDGRYTEQDGTLNLGDIVNPANGALNGLLGEDRFPTDLDLTLPYRHESRVRVIQPVFNEAIRAGHSAARHARDAAALGTRAAARRLAAEAQTAFLRVAAARAARRTYEATLLLVEENERVSQRRVDAGTATPDAVFRARAERSEVAQQLLEAREQEDAAARELNRILGRTLDSPVDTLPESWIALDLPVDEAEAIRRALGDREELGQVRAGMRGAEAGVRAATAAFLPAVSVALDYGFQGGDVAFTGDTDFWTASVVVSWNVFNGGQDIARRQGAQVDELRLRARLREVEDLIRVDVQRAWQAAAVARDAIAAAQDRLAAARRTFDLVGRRYSEGLATPLEFLDARTALTGAELNRIVTLYTWAIRRVDLERAAALRDIEGMETS